MARGEERPGRPRSIVVLGVLVVVLGAAGVAVLRPWTTHRPLGTYPELSIAHHGNMLGSHCMLEAEHPLPSEHMEPFAVPCDLSSSTVGYGNTGRVHVVPLYSMGAHTTRLFDPARMAVTATWPGYVDWLATFEDRTFFQTTAAGTVTFTELEPQPDPSGPASIVPASCLSSRPYEVVCASRSGPVFQLGFGPAQRLETPAFGALDRIDEWSSDVAVGRAASGGQFLAAWDFHSGRALWSHAIAEGVTTGHLLAHDTLGSTEPLVLPIGEHGARVALDRETGAEVPWPPPSE